MSISYIPEQVKRQLWGRAAGRCQYEGCNKPLWLDSLTKSEFNTAYIAHIIADKPAGPRGDNKLSKKLRSAISNLMLMCDVHHRLIDLEDVRGHSAIRLQAMKKAHEDRIEIVAGLGAEKETHILLYGANIGEHSAPVSYQKAARVMLPLWYPAETTPISLGMINSSFQDRDHEYWLIESRHLRTMVVQQVRPRLVDGSISHISVFALAPQPLLILLGTLLSDIYPGEVYQLHREPQTWEWQPGPEEFEYITKEPTSCQTAIALNLSLSATIDRLRIKNTFGNQKYSEWKITIPNPNTDYLRSRTQLQMFRVEFRKLLNRIKTKHGEEAVIHIFPAVPVSVAVEIGRAWQPKADLPMIIYDQNRKLDGFSQALNIGGVRND